MATVKFDAGKPATDADLSSLEMRQQLVAGQESIEGIPGNWVRDPGYMIRAAGETSAATHWRHSGGGTIAYAGAGLADTKRKEFPTCLKITSAGGVAEEHEQYLVPVANFPASWKGKRWVGVGAHLWCNDANKLEIGIYDGNSFQTAGFVQTAAIIGGDGFGWVSGAFLLHADADRVVVRAKLGSGTITGYVADITVTDGPVPPPHPIAPNQVWFVGTPPPQSGTLSTSPTTFVGAWRLDSPFPWIVREIRLKCGTAPTGQAIKEDFNKNGATMFATRPEIAAGATAGSATPDGTYANRCFARGDIFSQDHDQAGSGTAGADLTATFWGLAFKAPQDQKLGITDVN